MNQKPKKGIFRRFIDFTFKASFAWLAAYSFFFCQNPDGSPDSTVCHAISATHGNVLQPYAYPLIRHALSHPAINPYVTEIEPYVIRLHHTLQPAAAAVISKFHTHVIPGWNDVVIPQYHAYVAPHIQDIMAYLDPYSTVVTAEYERYLAPYLRVAAAAARELQGQARPYVILAWYKSVDGYRFAKPYTRPAWEQFKSVVLRVLACLSVSRRQFVDPHVAQMWAKIKELSGDKATPTMANPAPDPVPVAKDPLQEESSTVASISVEENTRAPVPGSAPIPSPVLSNDEKLSPEAPDVTTVTPPKQEPSPVLPHVDETPTPTHVPDRVSPANPHNQEELDSFAAEIGLDLDEAEDEFEDDETPFLYPLEESDEEREAKRKAKAEETAWKRQEITDRHTDWEYRLDDLKTEHLEVFKLSLHNYRKNSVKTMKENSEVRRAINGFSADGDKYLRGAETYLKNLIQEKKQDKSALWERVVKKLKEKFEARLDDLDGTVGKWHDEVTASEGSLVEKVATVVSDFSEKAQADLGLDYSWLDDVTTDDWVRYHDLMRCTLIPFRYSALVDDDICSNARAFRYTASDSFHDDLLKIQNGTHPDSAPNPILRALRELRVEVDGIMTGFQSRLSEIQGEGERTLGESNRGKDSPESKPTEEPIASILPIATEESIPQVVIGKSPEQVAEALKEAPLEDWAASKQGKPDKVRTHEEL